MTDVNRELVRYPVGDIRFNALSLSAAIDLICAWGSEVMRPGRAVHFANAYNVALASKDDGYATLINSGDLVCSDGMPVVWAGRWLHDQKVGEWDRVYGPDVFEGVLAAGGDIHHYCWVGPKRPLSLYGRGSNGSGRWRTSSEQRAPRTEQLLLASSPPVTSESWIPGQRSFG